MKGSTQTPTPWTSYSNNNNRRPDIFFLLSASHISQSPDLDEHWGSNNTMMLFLHTPLRARVQLHKHNTLLTTACVLLELQLLNVLFCSWSGNIISAPGALVSANTSSAYSAFWIGSSSIPLPFHTTSFRLSVCTSIWYWAQIKVHVLLCVFTWVWVWIGTRQHDIRQLTATDHLLCRLLSEQN